MRTRGYILISVAGLALALVVGACAGQAEAGEVEHDMLGHDPASPHDQAQATSVDNGFDGMPPVGTRAVCPVTKEAFEVAKGTPSSVFQGKTYVFCCPGCKPQFEADPKKFL